MECEVVDGERMALALGALQGRVQWLQKARRDAVAERTALEARADQLDAAVDAALDAAIRAHTLEDPPLIQYLTRRAYRDEWLYTPAASIYPDRRWATLD